MNRAQQECEPSSCASSSLHQHGRGMCRRGACAAGSTKLGFFFFPYVLRGKIIPPYDFDVTTQSNSTSKDMQAPGVSEQRPQTRRRHLSGAQRTVCSRTSCAPGGRVGALAPTTRLPRAAWHRWARTRHPWQPPPPTGSQGVSPPTLAGSGPRQHPSASIFSRRVGVQEGA